MGYQRKLYSIIAFLRGGKKTLKSTNAENPYVSRVPGVFIAIIEVLVFGRKS
jgi:hypothetical protein